MSPLRAAIVAEARTWLGTPFHHNARVKGAGVDCVQLLAAVYEAVGLLRGVQIGDYPADWMLHRNDQRVLQGLERVAQRTAHPQPGDVVLCRSGRALSHVGIVLQWPRIVHADAQVGVCELDALRSPQFAARIDSWWSIVDRARIVVEGV